MIARLKFYLTHSINDLRVNRQRTLFALLCIAAGVAAIVSLQTLGVMINETLTGNLQESNRGDIVLRANGTTEQGYTTELDEAMFASIVFTPKGVAHIQEWLDEHYPGSTITYTQPLNGFGVGWSMFDIDRDTDKMFIMNYIVDAERYPIYGRVESLDGKRLSELLREPTDIVLSENLADDLDARIGDRVRVSGALEDFIVRGIVPTDAEAGLSGSEFGFIAGLFGYYYLDHDAVALFDKVTPGQAVQIFVRLADPDTTEAAQKQLDRSFWWLDTSSTIDLEKQNSLISENVDDMVIIMGLISLLIGGIGIINTMLVIVSRRTTEVAVLKTLGLQPNEITVLFLVEAVLMGIFGSLLGILMGWGLAYVTKGIAETFLGQSLTFVPAILPAVNGLIVGVVITVIFGFLPTLAAGQIRPANVLRPSDTVIPKAGRLSAFAAVIVLIMVLSLVAQGLMGDLLNDLKNLDMIMTGIGAGYGLLIALALILSDFLSMRRRRRGRSWLLHLLMWIVLLPALVAGGVLFARNVPALLLLTVTGVLVVYLYVLFWLIIWAVGGGRIKEIMPGVLVLLFPAFWPLIPVLLVILLPVWLLGRLIQRFAFVDLKIAMRGMLATKGRGASTLLALVIGIFTLSVITMLVDSITNAFEELLEDIAGGNVFVFTANNDPEALYQVRDKLAAEGKAESLRSFAVVSSYSAQVISVYDASAGRNMNRSEIDDLGWSFGTIDGREIDSNLPDVKFAAGRQLDPTLDTQPDAEGRWSAIVREARGNEGEQYDIGVGDVLTLRVGEDTRKEITFVIVGVTSDAGLTVGSGAAIYAPYAAFEGAAPQRVAAIADVKESDIKQVRRSINEVPGVFVLETRFINDLVNRVIDQFTSFPILVAALALFTGGFVIANSVALSTMERRREIGVMKAIGLQRERVLGMLLLENGLMGLIGGLIGVGISFIILLFILYQLFEKEMGTHIPYGLAFGLMGLCILISLVAAVWSVWTASGEKPLNTLRYE